MLFVLVIWNNFSSGFSSASLTKIYWWRKTYDRLILHNNGSTRHLNWMPFLFVCLSVYLCVGVCGCMWHIFCWFSPCGSLLAGLWCQAITVIVDVEMLYFFRMNFCQKWHLEDRCSFYFADQLSVYGQTGNISKHIPSDPGCGTNLELFQINIALLFWLNCPVTIRCYLILRVSHNLCMQTQLDLWIN